MFEKEIKDFSEITVGEIIDPHVKDRLGGPLGSFCSLLFLALDIAVIVVPSAPDCGRVSQPERPRISRYRTFPENSVTQDAFWIKIPSENVESRGLDPSRFLFPRGEIPSDRGKPPRSRPGNSHCANCCCVNRAGVARVTQFYPRAIEALPPQATRTSRYALYMFDWFCSNLRTCVLLLCGFFCYVYV